MTTRELERLLDLLERLLDLLARFSEDPDLSGALRDEIASIRSEIWDRLEAKDIR
jgi:hypothetical protein